jgi:hypothetical protein
MNEAMNTPTQIRRMTQRGKPFTVVSVKKESMKSLL